MNYSVDFSRQAACAVFASCVLCPVAAALPLSPTVIHGSAIFETVGSTLNITPVTPSVIIHWQSFSVASAEAVNFSSAAGWAVLNRITGDDTSMIAGRLYSPANIGLVNRAGILSNGQAEFETGDLLLSAVQISDADFISQAGDFERFSYQWQDGAGPVRLNDQSIVRSKNSLHMAGANISIAAGVTLQTDSYYLEATEEIVLGVPLSPTGPVIIVPNLPPIILSPIPEPGTGALLLGGCALLQRRRLFQR